MFEDDECECWSDAESEADPLDDVPAEELAVTELEVNISEYDRIIDGFAGWSLHK